VIEWKLLAENHCPIRLFGLNEIAPEERVETILRMLCKMNKI